MFYSAARAFTMTPVGGVDAIPPAGVPHTRALYVGGAGTLQIVTSFGDTVTYTNVIAGTGLRVEVAKVVAAGTTATGIVGHY